MSRLVANVSLCLGFSAILFTSGKGFSNDPKVWVIGDLILEADTRSTTFEPYGNGGWSCKSMTGDSSCFPADCQLANLNLPGDNMLIQSIEIHALHQWGICIQHSEYQNSCTAQYHRECARLNFFLNAKCHFPIYDTRDIMTTHSCEVTSPPSP